VGHPPAPDGAVVAASQTTTSTSYTDLATSGPTVTVTVSSSGKALVTLTAYESITGADNSCFMGFAVSGVTTVAASDTQSVQIYSESGTVQSRGSASYLVTGLNPGINTFTAKYKSSAGITCTFANRSIIVTPY
jgi:hypothetical protein